MFLIIILALYKHNTIVLFLYLMMVQKYKCTICFYIIYFFKFFPKSFNSSWFAYVGQLMDQQSTYYESISHNCIHNLLIDDHIVLLLIYLNYTDNKE